MRFLADEGVDRQIVIGLRKVGFVVDYIAELSSGMDDESVLGLANTNKAILLTTDKDFGRLVFRQRRINKGVILLRLLGLPSKTKVEIVVSVIKEHEAGIENSFSVIMPEGIRIRPG